MIKIFLLSVIALTGMIGFTSCTDYLDKSPNSDIAENDPYKNFKNFQGFIEELYNRIPIVSNNDYILVSTMVKMNIGNRKNFVFLLAI